MKAVTCEYCGNNPVPHRIFWYQESLNILLTPLRQKLLFNPATRIFKRKGWSVLFSRFFLRLGEALHIVTRQDNSSLCKIRRAQVLWEAAEKRSIKMQELLVFGRAVDAYTAHKNNKKPEEIIFSGLPRPAGYFNNQLDLMDDKAWLKIFLKKHNLPVSEGAAVTRWNEAKKIFDQIQKPVIVKPRAGSRGRHSTTFIQNLEQLKHAYKVGKQLCHWVMVEEQLFGPVYRATLINFKLEGVLRGDPPSVTGDGSKTILELINQKNSITKDDRIKNIKIDAQIRIFLQRQNLTLESILAAGQTVNLSEKVGLSYGGSSKEDFDICHEDNKELFVRAAQVLGDPIVGFDFIIPDIAKSWRQQKCGFIEVNTLPFINLHHDPLLGQPRDVASKIWEMLKW